jgi:hypothetical protein
MDRWRMFCLGHFHTFFPLFHFSTPRNRNQFLSFVTALWWNIWVTLYHIQPFIASVVVAELWNYLINYKWTVKCMTFEEFGIAQTFYQLRCADCCWYGVVSCKAFHAL